MFSFICCSNNNEILNKCVKKSLKLGLGDELLILNGFPNLSMAYIVGEQRARNDLLVFIHQDVYFPRGWINSLIHEIRRIESVDKNWGVIGTFGCYLKITGQKVLVTKIGNVTGLKKDWICNLDELPRKVETLDAFVCVKKRGLLQFDENIPNFHGAVEDLYYQAKSKNMGVWVVNLNTGHYTPEINRNPKQIQESSYYLMKKWPLPLVCGNVVWGG